MKSLPTKSTEINAPQNKIISQYNEDSGEDQDKMSFNVVPQMVLSAYTGHSKLSAYTGHSKLVYGNILG